MATFSTTICLIVNQIKKYKAIMQINIFSLCLLLIDLVKSGDGHTQKSRFCFQCRISTRLKNQLRLTLMYLKESSRLPCKAQYHCSTVLPTTSLNAKESKSDRCLSFFRPAYAGASMSLPIGERPW